MREAEGDLWAYPANTIVVPINWVIRPSGPYMANVMGADVALQAKQRYPELELHIGDFIERYGKEPQAFTLPTWDGLTPLIAFPTKRDYRKPSTLALVEQSARQLVNLIEPDDIVALPRVGCGERTGRLAWSDVKPILERYLDDRFVVLSLPPSGLTATGR